MTATLTADDLEFEIRRSKRRKTLQLTVDRGGELILMAPEGLELATLEEFVKENRFWLYTKLAQKDALHNRASAKEFVSGESFPYLGRHYRLLLVDVQDEPLKLDHGRFRLQQAAARNGRDHFVRWYMDHAEPWLARRVASWVDRVGARPTEIAVKDLGFRWASCSKNGTVNFHWTTMTLPPGLIDYVIVHELVHLHERNHTPGFWQRLERAMPDFEERKARLAESGRAFVGL